MTTAYTSLLGLALPVTGENSGTWGDLVNQSITSLLDSAVAGTTTLSTDADVTLTTTAGAANTAREAILLWTAGGTVTRNITAPAQSKIYTVINASSSTQSIKLVGAGPTTGVTIIKGESALCAWNGSDFIKISNTAGSGVFSSITNTGLTSGRVVYSTTGGLETDSANLTFNGTTLTANTLNLTNALGTTYGGTGLTSFTANGVVYASSTSALATGSALTFDGNNLTVAATTPNAIINNASSSTLAGTIFQYSGTAFARDRATAGTGEYRHEVGLSVGFGGFHTWYLDTAEQMRLTSTGLGIGTSSPSARLTSKAIGNGYVNSAGLSLLGAVSGTSYITNIGGALYVSNDGSTDQLVLNSSGNLGLGVTPSAWGANYSAMQFRTKAAIGNYSGTDSIELLSNAYANADNAFKYIETYSASRYAVSAGAHQWYIAPSGTAGNAITFTQAMTLDASGNLLVGTTTTGGVLRVFGATGKIIIGDTSTNYFDADTQIFRSSGATERARIDSSGNLLVGTTSAWGGSPKMEVRQTAATWGLSSYLTSTSSGIGALLLRVDNTAPYLAGFYYGGSTLVGTITTNGTTTTYGVTSDYRLKTVVGAVSGSGERIDALEPIEYTWNSNGQRTRGFLAHKFQEVYADSVTGAKDAIDANGKPVYQAMQASSSEVIADLVAEIQSLRKRLTALEGKA
jgi:hypothetical protein